MRRVFRWSVLMGFGALLASAFPDIKRYIKLRNM